MSSGVATVKVVVVLSAMMLLIAAVCYMAGIVHLPIFSFGVSRVDSPEIAPRLSLRGSSDSVPDLKIFQLSTDRDPFWSTDAPTDDRLRWAPTGEKWIPTLRPEQTGPAELSLSGRRGAHPEGLKQDATLSDPALHDSTFRDSTLHDPALIGPLPILIPTPGGTWYLEPRLPTTRPSQLKPSDFKLNQ